MFGAQTLDALQDPKGTWLVVAVRSKGLCEVQDRGVWGERMTEAVDEMG